MNIPAGVPGSPLVYLRCPVCHSRILESQANLFDPRICLECGQASLAEFTREDPSWEHELRLWEHEGKAPHFFLLAVLANDLKAAIQSSTWRDRLALKEVVRFVSTLSQDCRGSWSSVSRWKILHGGINHVV